MSKVQIVWFRDLKLWSVALQNQTTLKSHFPLIELKEILVDLTEHRKITILDNEFYKEPTISSKTNEISIRKSGLGNEFKVKKRIKILKGDLVIAKMHTQNGLYAFANDEFASTTTFIPFKILENKINKNYLFILLKQTLARLQKFDSVNRETYKTDEILSLQIPLPPLKIQQQIVAKIESIKAQIKALQEEEKRLKDEIEAYIYIALGLEEKKHTQKQKVFVVNFKDLERWDITYNQGINTMIQNIIKYNRVKLKDICLINPNVDFKELVKQNKQVSFVPMEAVSSNGVDFYPKDRKASDYKGFTKFQDNDLLWAKITPCMQNKKSVVVKNLKNGFGFGSTEFFVIRPRNKDEVDINFILHFLRMDCIIENAKLHFKGSAGQQRVPKEFLENLQIPLPPLKIQQEMINFVESKRDRIKANQKTIQSLQDSMSSELEYLLIV